MPALRPGGRRRLVAGGAAVSKPKFGVDASAYTAQTSPDECVLRAFEEDRLRFQRERDAALAEVKLLTETKEWAGKRIEFLEQQLAQCRADTVQECEFLERKCALAVSDVMSGDAKRDAALAQVAALMKIITDFSPWLALSARDYMTSPQIRAELLEIEARVLALADAKEPKP